MMNSAWQSLLWVFGFVLVSTAKVLFWLKLLKIIDWSWWLVALPLYPVLACALALLAMMILTVIAEHIAWSKWNGD